MSNRAPFHKQLCDELSGRRALVTGASGFVGRWLAMRLNEVGADVHGLGRNLSRMPSGIRGWAVDLRHFDAVRAAMDAIRPEFVFHLAAFVTARRDRGLIRPMLEHTLLGTVQLLHAVADMQCRRVVLVSSAEAPLDAVTAPKSPYAAAKASAELFASMFHHVYGLPIVTLRPTLVYGPGQPHDKLLPYIITSLLRGGEPSLMNPDRICDVLYVRDLVDALCLAAVGTDINGKAIALGSGTRLSIGDLAQRVAGLCSKCCSHAPSLSRPVNESDLVVDTEPAFRLLSWRAQWTLHEGLCATLPAYAPRIERREVA
jgi:nucleoside-diphosphate-sugar epimerase